MSAWCYWENGEDADLVDRASESIEHALVWNGHSREGEVFVWRSNQSYQWSIAFYCQSWVVQALPESPFVPQFRSWLGKLLLQIMLLPNNFQLSSNQWLRMEVTHQAKCSTSMKLDIIGNACPATLSSPSSSSSSTLAWGSDWASGFTEAEVSKARQQIVDITLQVKFE